MVLLSSHSLLLPVIPLLYISMSLLLLIKMDLQFYLYVFFFFEGANYQVLTSSNSVTKLIDIAALLGKSMGMWYARVCSFMFH